MYELIKLFFAICIFKKAPQDIPYSAWLFKLTLFAYAFISFMIIYLSAGWWSALLQVMVGVGLTIFFCWIILKIFNKTARFYQVATALFGTDAMLNFFAVPALSTVAAGHDTAFTDFFLLGLMIWHWLVSGFIFKNALSASFFLGLGVAMLYIVSSSMIMANLFPQIINTG